MPTFTVSNDGVLIGAALIQHHYRELTDVPIYWTEIDGEPPARIGCRQVGKLRKLSDFERWLGNHERDALQVILLTRTWARFTPEEARNALDHLLSHVSLEGEKLIINDGHDVETNLADLERNGLWNDALRRLNDVVRQIPMPEPEASESNPDAAGEQPQSDNATSEPTSSATPLWQNRPAIGQGFRLEGTRCPRCKSTNCEEQLVRIYYDVVEKIRFCLDCRLQFRLALPEPAEQPDEQPVDALDVAFTEVAPTRWSDTSITDAIQGQPEAGPSGWCRNCEAVDGQSSAMEPQSWNHTHDRTWACGTCGYEVAYIVDAPSRRNTIDGVEYEWSDTENRWLRADRGLGAGATTDVDPFSAAGVEPEQSQDATPYDPNDPTLLINTLVDDDSPAERAVYDERAEARARDILQGNDVETIAPPKRKHRRTRPLEETQPEESDVEPHDDADRVADAEQRALDVEDAPEPTDG